MLPIRSPRVAQPHHLGIAAAVHGPKHLGPPVAAGTDLDPRLTRRELEILRLVSEGFSNPQVGQLLWVTDETVKFHLRHVYRKLGVTNRFEAAHWAYEHGLVEAADEGGALVA